MDRISFLLTINSEVRKAEDQILKWKDKLIHLKLIQGEVEEEIRENIRSNTEKAVEGGEADTDTPEKIVKVE